MGFPKQEIPLLSFVTLATLGKLLRDRVEHIMGFLKHVDAILNFAGLSSVHIVTPDTSRK